VNSTQARTEPHSVSAASSLGVLAQFVRLLPLILLLAAGAGFEFRGLASLEDVNVWGHLRTGLWILQIHGVPHTALFSRESQLPWADTSWGFDLLLAAAYQKLGLAAIPLAMMLFRFALAGVTFLLAQGRRGSFWPALILSALAQFCIGRPAPGPALFSIVFFGVELLLLEEARKRNPCLLYWLPVLFFVWTNLDSAFVAGLLILPLFLAALAVESRWRADASASSLLSLRSTALVAVLCVVASLLNPYTYHPYVNFLADLYSRASFLFFPEMRALGFRSPRDYVLILFVLSAFFVLGRRPARHLFLLFVLLATLPVLVRIQRDVWLAVLPATAVLAAPFAGAVDQRSGLARSRFALLTAALVSFALVMALFFRLPAPQELQRRVARRLPVDACEFVRQNHLPGPLFNMPNWGGYLAFALPDYPVAIDNRMSIYGDDRYIEFQKLAVGAAKLEEVPDFILARVLVLESDSDLARALTELPALTERYQVLYRDDVAVVLQPR
jgi:hypothetical protein